MSNTPKILAFAGSTRKGSHNHKLVSYASRLAEQQGATVTLLDLSEYDLPLFNEDLEAEGTPENAFRLKDLFLSHQGLLIASPEYNSSITPLLKNVLDWVSRPAPDEPRLAAYQGKVAGLIAASAGNLGGMRGLVHLRDILGNVGVHVIPTEAAVSRVHEAFDNQGEMTDEAQASRVKNVVELLVRTVSRLSE